jgi:SPP1 family predicted phage head-tail adaptor
MQPRRLSTNYAYASTGSLTNQVTLVKASSSRTPTGEFVQKHEAVAVVWARIQMLAAKYTEKTEKVVTEATDKVTIRYIPGVTTALMVQHADGRLWNIEGVFDTDEKHVELALFCYERP